MRGECGRHLRCRMGGETPPLPFLGFLAVRHLRCLPRSQGTTRTKGTKGSPEQGFVVLWAELERSQSGPTLKVPFQTSPLAGNGI